MEPYTYQALPAVPSIRLIKLNTGSQDDDTLSCNFAVAEIAALPQYTALSYVWGDASDTCPIRIDGKSLPITRSLAGALQHLAKTPGLLVWADAVCINQKDDIEKSHQVNMMATIYSKATKVTVWLGPDHHNDAPRLFLAMRRTVDAFRIMAARAEPDSRPDAVDREAALWLEDLGSDGSPFESITNPKGDDKAGVVRFFRLPWFSRTWILQEVGLASDAVMIWGEHSIPWHTVGLISMILRQGFLQSGMDQLGLRMEIERAFHAYTIYSPLIPGASFLHVINNTRRFSATQPQDKIYALLSHPAALKGRPATEFPTWSAYEPVLPIAVRLLTRYQDRYLVRRLAQERRQSGAQLSDSLQPPFMQADYTKSADQVYHEFALNHISKTGSLEILSTVQHDPARSSPLFSPSWVPRWDYFIDTPTLGLFDCRHFAAANKRPIITASPEVPNSLRVRGHLFSRIVLHSQLLSASDFDLPLPEDMAVLGPDSALVQDRWSRNPISHIWLSRGLAGAPNDSYPVLPMWFADTENGPYAVFNKTADNLFHAYMRTWVTGKNMAETDGFDLTADADAYWRRLFWGTEVERDEEDDVGHSIRWKRYRDSAALVCNQRRFFMTTRGFFGIGPGAMQLDDFVTVLLGLDVPIVIREVAEEGEPSLEDRRKMNMPVPMDRKFQVVGECYVDGLMQGQLAAQEFIRDITLV
ncbi:hypothetical protein MFIFM68171_06335 [Madurella fahalii]|uniref:Heterokaryon incompatibility domain-containing protein n=1 Tax=Madurella fahalii TaxID=1157608 RepID=A0ABQ0GEZ6_9PEZI